MNRKLGVLIIKKKKFTTRIHPNFARNLPASSSAERWIDASSFSVPRSAEKTDTDWVIEEFSSDEDVPSGVKHGSPFCSHTTDCTCDVRIVSRDPVQSFYQFRSEPAESGASACTIEEWNKAPLSPILGGAKAKRRLSCTAAGTSDGDSYTVRPGADLGVETMNSEVEPGGEPSSPVFERKTPPSAKRNLSSLYGGKTQRSPVAEASRGSSRDFPKFEDFIPEIRRSGRSSSRRSGSQRSTVKKFTGLRLRSAKFQAGSDVEIDESSPLKPKLAKQESDQEFEISECPDGPSSSWEALMKRKEEVQSLVPVFKSDDQEIVESRNPKRIGKQHSVMKRLKDAYYWFRDSVNNDSESRECYRVRFLEKISSIVLLQVEPVKDAEKSCSTNDLNNDQIIIYNYNLWRISCNPGVEDLLYLSRTYYTKIRLFSTEMILAHFIERYVDIGLRRNPCPPVFTVQNSSSEEDDPTKWYKHIRMPRKRIDLSADCLLPVNLSSTPPSSPDLTRKGPSELEKPVPNKEDGDESDASVKSYVFFNGALEDSIFTQI